MNSWSGAAAAAIVGCPYSNLDAWDRAGVVRPSVPASGPGTRRGYTFQELIALTVANELLATGASRRVAAIVAEHVASRRGLATPTAASRSAAVWIFSDGTSAWEIREGQSLARPRTQVPAAFYAIPLRPVIAQLCARIANPASVRRLRRRRAST